MHFMLLKKLIYEAQLGGRVSQGASGAIPHIPLAPWKAPLAPCNTSLTDLWVKHHPRGNVVLARPEDFTALLWNVEAAACMTVLSGHGG
ncbi:unnamed protein product [Sphagnum jensenii]|uniref:Uncharacterized protein n=1 Tax=Sphagnum jensenii TaxID=128206 RepID=A0ABP1A4V1_9BRYO